MTRHPSVTSPFCVYDAPPLCVTSKYRHSAKKDIEFFAGDDASCVCDTQKDDVSCVCDLASSFLHRDDASQVWGGYD